MADEEEIPVGGKRKAQPGSDEKAKAEADAECLLEAEAIKADKDRHDKAMVIVREMKDAMEAKAKAAKNMSERKMRYENTPGMEME